MLDRFPVYPVLAASDIQRAKAWYEEKLGVKPDREDMTGGLWFRFADECWLLVYPTQAAGTAQNTVAHVQVTDLTSVMQELRGRGVTFEVYDFPPFADFHKGDGLYEMGGYKGCWFKDSEGNTIEMAEVEAG